MNFLYCFDENYNIQASISIHSLLEHLETKVNIHIIHKNPHSFNKLLKKIKKHKNLSNIFTLHDMLVNLKSSSFGLPMRYHGHIFMAAIGIPFISIDYTGKGGKISSLMNRYGLQKMSISTNQLNKDDVLAPLFFLMKNEMLKEV